MPFERIGVFITTDGGPVDPPPNPPEKLTKIVAPIGIPNKSFDFEFETPKTGVWFTPTDGLSNITGFNQIFVFPGDPRGRKVQLFVSARERGASIIGFINGL